MCDYSLQHVRTRKAQVGDTLVTTNFNTGTRGFSTPQEPKTATCLLPGTEISFAGDVHKADGKIAGPAVATFCQINTHMVSAHHDALKFANGEIILITQLADRQTGTVLQLPADPSTLEGNARRQAEDAQRRVEYIG